MEIQRGERGLRRCPSGELQDTVGDDGQGEAVAAFLVSPPSSWQAASQRILGYSCV